MAIPLGKRDAARWKNHAAVKLNGGGNCQSLCPAPVYRPPVTAPEASVRSFLIAPLLQFAANLRFKWLFLGTLSLFILTLFVPDPFPFADEILFGLATLVLSQWKTRRVPPESGTGAAPSDTDAGKAPREVIDLPRDRVKREG
jgi:hypothetical protein